MFLEATTVVSKKPDHRSSSTQKTKRLNHHCNTHIIAGTIFTVTAMIQGYDSEKLRKKGRRLHVLCAYEKVFITMVVNLELFLYSDFLYTLSIVVTGLDVL